MQLKHDLTSRELVQKVLQHKVSDYLPKGELCINEDVIQQSLGAEKVGFPEKLAFVQGMGLDIYSLSPQYSFKPEKLPARETYRWPDLKEWTVNTSIFIFGVLDGAFEWGMRLLGPQKFCSQLRSRLMVEALIAQVEKLNFYMIDKLAGEGVNGLILADDIAYQQGLFAHPKVFREFFIPSLARQVERILKLGLPVFYHSDGNYSSVLDDIIKTGITGLQCLEKTAGMQIEEIQSKVDVCLWGHLDTDDLEAAANDAALLQELIKSARELAQGKKFILGTTSGLYAGMEIEALRSIYANV
ncbi:MAG: hypothetical protein GX893_03630 [Firmicutes bacterium]|nr:hypothetical protein [Bacillota bacterium]